jgi:hypothetical protein
LLPRYASEDDSANQNDGGYDIGNTMLFDGQGNAADLTQTVSMAGLALIQVFEHLID